MNILTRCNASQFAPTKSQKKVAKKVKNFLKRGKGSAEPSSPPLSDSSKKGVKRKDKEDDFTDKDENGGESEEGGELSSVREELRTLRMKKADARRGERRLQRRLESEKDRRIDDDWFKVCSGSQDQLATEEKYKHQARILLN